MINIQQYFRSSVLALCFTLFFVSICSATLTIYYKDGSSREAHKIMFKGSVAEIYLVDGTVVTVPVDQLDLPSSGIGAPVGTYGTSKMTGERTKSDQKSVLGSPVRQARLRDEWERAEKFATVTKSIGPMHPGDTVKIIVETTAKSRASKDDYYDNPEFWWDKENRGYRFKPKNLDHAYVIVYKNPDGSFGKRLFDAVTFNSHFKIAQNPKTTAPMPEYPIVPDKKERDIHEPNTFSPPKPTPEVSELAPIAGEEAKEVNPSPARVEPAKTPEPEEMQRSSRRRSWIAYLIFVAVVAALGVGAWFVIVRSQRPYIDTSKFDRYEEDLREFEVAIWLRNGKTADQLMEICLKKFYQDNPAVISICNKMLKGGQKGLIVPFIAKQTGRSADEAAKIYEQIQNQIERIRLLIREVSQKTGINPAKPAVESTPKTAPVEISATAPPPKGKVPVPPPLPRPASVATAAAAVPQEVAPVVGNATSSVALNAAAPAAQKSSAVHLIEPDAPMRSAADLPQYANSVLNQISFLSSSEEK